MTPKERAAMQQALEVLRLAKNSHGIMLMSDPPKDAWRFHDVDLKLVAAITALREALAEQAEQEPVAWRCTRNDISDINYADDDESLKYFERRNYDIEPLYAAPVRTKDLTDDEIDECRHPYEGAYEFARAVIAAYKEKNK